MQEENSEVVCSEVVVDKTNWCQDCILLLVVTQYLLQNNINVQYCELMQNRISHVQSSMMSGNNLLTYTFLQRSTKQKG